MKKSRILIDTSDELFVSLYIMELQLPIDFGPVKGKNAICRTILPVIFGPTNEQNAIYKTK